MNKVLGRLSPRDRLILRWAVPVIALLIVVLGSRALLGERRENTAQLDLVLEDIAWLQAQSDAVSAARQGCARSPWNDNLPDRLAARYKVSISRGGAGGGQLELTINSGHGNGVIAYLQALECQGVGVVELTLETLDQQGMVKGRALLQPPVT